MLPDEVPIFSASDMLAPGGDEYEKGKKKTCVGWMKHLFLYNIADDGDKFDIPDKDRKDYEKVAAAFVKANSLPTAKFKRVRADWGIEEWEDDVKNGVRKQATAMNKCMVELGYDS